MRLLAQLLRPVRRARTGTASPRPTANRFRPAVHELEPRLVPSTLDLTTPNALGAVNGAVFRQNADQPTGSGVIHSFVRLQAAGVEQGYNTDSRPLQFDENNSPTFTRSLNLSDVPTATVGGVTFRVFALDINQKSSAPLLSLDELRLYVGGAGNLSGYNPTTHQLAGLTPVYDLGAGNWIKLNAGLNPGSGKGDMLAYIPESAFAGAGPDDFVYLYSKFGVNNAGNGGYEEWSVASNPPADFVLPQGVAGVTGVTAAPAGLSGYVLNPFTHTAFIGFTVTLSGFDNQGNAVTLTATTDANGYYNFTNVPAGTYTLTAPIPSGYVDSGDQVGTVNGMTNGTQNYTGVISGIILNAGDNGINYDFTFMVPAAPPPA
jgi:hypothetical protein